MPIKYSTFCTWDEPKNILVCPEKPMPKLSDVEDIPDESPFQTWINGLHKDNGQSKEQDHPYTRQRLNRK